MYQDKLAQLKKQLQQLQEGTLPEYLRRLKRIEQQYKERLRLNDTWQACCVCIGHLFVIFELCTVSCVKVISRRFWFSDMMRDFVPKHKTILTIRRKNAAHLRRPGVKILLG